MPQSMGIYYCMSQGTFPTPHPPVVLIHGAGASHLCWPAELRRLPGYTVYTLDLPGHGRSVGTGQHTISAYARKVIDFLSSLGIYEAILVGHSMGAAIALQAAYEYPNQVNALGLIACGAYIGVPPDLIENLSNPTMMPVAFEWFRKHLFWSSTSESIMIKTLRILEQARPGVLYGDWQACAQFDLRAKVSEIAAPAWIAAGAEDHITPLSYANFLTSQLKQVRMQILEDAGHMLILEKPQALEAGLTAFLKELEDQV
jgi:pimeloyl-ACP methyl ester carboxylesterase